MKKEKFLFFFLARERKTYSVELDITVNVTMIDTDKVAFITK
ncbi:putative cytoplasmic protein [Yersinia enterocolitica]|nr:putative cytoplasmic protein [Yersinia enterocolitica]